MSGGNVPYKYSPDAQAERNWKAKNERDGANYNWVKFDKEKYRSNYDEIDWSAKSTGSKK
jgi:hypothetical protein